MYASQPLVVQSQTPIHDKPGAMCGYRTLSIIPLLIQLIDQPVLGIATIAPRPPTTIGALSPKSTIDTAVASPGRQAARARGREDDEDIL